jgi:hypothetical protein
MVNSSPFLKGFAQYGGVIMHAVFMLIMIIFAIVLDLYIKHVNGRRNKSSPVKVGSPSNLKENIAALLLVMAVLLFALFLMLLLGII